MEITTVTSVPNGKHFLVDGKVMGSINQNPNHPDVSDPAKWTGAIYTKDEGAWFLSQYDSEEEAVAAAIEAIKKDWTYAQWCEFESSQTTP
jgi:hypothetical protein